MSRINILNIVDELNNKTDGSKISITFLTKTNSDNDEPTIIINEETLTDINVTVYLSEIESDLITYDELNELLHLLVKQEIYRRKVIFRNAVTSAKP